jgi:ketosteroid isomerase-like protein
MRTIAPSLTGLLATATLIASVAANAAPCTTMTEPAAATADLYLKMTARDACVLQYVPTDGFDEIDTRGERHHLGADAFRGLFASPAHIEFHADDVEAERFGNTAVVTGIRVGGVTAEGAAPATARASFTMVWVLSEGGWQLHHAHLSPTS